MNLTTRVLLLSTVLTVILFLNSCQMNQPKHTGWTYPETSKDSITDDYHGTKIADPYRWLEDDYADNTKAWVKDQNAFTASHLAQVEGIDKIKERLTELWNFERYGVPRKEGDDLLYFKNDGLQNQSVLYRVVAEGEDEVIIDPNTLSEDGTTSLGGISFSEDGKLLAYQISEGGSDWRTAKVLDLETMEPLEDKIDWIKFSGLAWYKDGFFYSRYPATEASEELSGKNEFHSLYYHKLGTNQKEDVLVYRDQDHPNRNVYATVDDDENYLILNIVESTSGNALKLAELGGEVSKLSWMTVVDQFDHDYNYIATHNGQLVFMTNGGAANQKVIEIDPQNVGSDRWKTVIPEQKETLRWLTKAGDYFVAGYLKDAHSMAKVFDASWKAQPDLELPTLGTIGAFRGNKKNNEVYYAFTSFTYPTTIFKVNLDDRKSEIYQKPTLNIDLNQFETIQEWYTSKDGTKVPMFITQKKGLKDKAVPTLLYGYGGFNIAIEPSFSVSNLILLENGGRHVVANIRGGGEFGTEWHKAGTLERKQNVFDDFIGAAEYLIKKGYTTSDLLAIEGGSNGGLLVGACMTQRPDLFQVAYPRVGVLDMLRYHEFTIGWAWATDYGRSDDPEAFDYLIKYSPLHNVKKTDYPATMIMTADHDDRVVPAHSFKFAAELQDKHTGEDPILIRIETSAGHGAGKPTSKRIEEEADKWGFMFHHTGHQLLN